MQTKEYLQLVESKLKNYFSDKYEIDTVDLEVVQVWYCKTVQNHKGLFIIRNSYGLIYDNFIEDGHQMSDLYLVIVEVFKVSGLIREEEVEEKN